jgi:hypothetical protein
MLTGLGMIGWAQRRRFGLWALATG